MPQPLGIDYVPDSDLTRMVRIMSDPSVNDVEFLIVWGETEAIGFRERVGDKRQRPGVGIDTIDGFRQFQLVPSWCMRLP
jgi:hypothetical protein